MREIDGLVEQRQLRMAIIDMLAQRLPGSARDAFVQAQHAKLERDLPTPSRHHMRIYLRSV